MGYRVMEGWKNTSQKFTTGTSTQRRLWHNKYFKSKEWTHGIEPASLIHRNQIGSVRDITQSVRYYESRWHRVAPNILLFSNQNLRSGTNLWHCGCSPRIGKTFILQEQRIDPDLIGARSLRSGGAMDLNIMGYNDYKTRKFGRWTSDTW